jgi:hypothetical protein
MAVGFFGKLLLKQVSPTVKSLKPKVGSLKTRRTTQEDVIKSADKAIKKNKLTKEQGVAVKKSIAPGLRKISKTQDRIDKITRQKKMGGGMMGRRMGYSQGSKPDFLDLDKDGNTSESMKSAAKQAKRK